MSQSRDFFFHKAYVHFSKQKRSIQIRKQDMCREIITELNTIKRSYPALISSLFVCYIFS